MVGVMLYYGYVVVNTKSEIHFNHKLSFEFSDRSQSKYHLCEVRISNGISNRAHNVSENYRLTNTQ